MGQGAQEGGSGEPISFVSQNSSLASLSSPQNCAAHDKDAPLLCYFLTKYEAWDLPSGQLTMCPMCLQICALLGPTGSKVNMSITCCIPDSVNRLVPPHAPQGECLPGPFPAQGLAFYQAVF